MCPRRTYSRRPRRTTRLAPDRLLAADYSAALSVNLPRCASAFEAASQYARNKRAERRYARCSGGSARRKEWVMSRKLIAALAVVVLTAASAYAQERGVGAGRIEIGAFPGGGMFFTKTSNGNEPAFGNYALGGSFTVNANKFVGFEGEGGGTLGV